VKVGETYRFVQHARSIYNGAETGFVFVVVSEIENFRMSEADDMDKPGFIALLLKGEFKGTLPGSTFSFSRKSFIAFESVRFPAEE